MSQCVLGCNRNQWSRVPVLGQKVSWAFLSSVWIFVYKLQVCVLFILPVQIQYLKVFSNDWKRVEDRIDMSQKGKPSIKRRSLFLRGCSKGWNKSGLKANSLREWLFAPLNKLLGLLININAIVTACIWCVLVLYLTEKFAVPEVSWTRRDGETLRPGKLAFTHYKLSSMLLLIKNSKCCWKIMHFFSSPMVLLFRIKSKWCTV